MVETRDTPSVIELEDQLGDVKTPAAGKAFLYLRNNQFRIKRSTGIAEDVGPRSVPGGRLTIASGTPVLTSTVLNATLTYYTPYFHDRFPIYDGSIWIMRQLAEISNDTTQSAVGSAGPAAVVPNSNYDLFIWDDAGTLRLTRGPVWTSFTARSAGTALVRVQGTLMNAVAIVNGPALERGTYVGTISSDPTSTIDWKHGGKGVGGSSAYFNVWNMYNRVEVSAESRESTISWTYAGGVLAWRAINNALNNRVSYVVGLAEDPVDAVFHCNTAGGGVPYVGIGLDSVTVRWGSSTFNALAASFGQIMGIAKVNQLGFHFLQAIEFNNDPVTAALFYGDIGLPLIAQNGLFFRGMF